MAAVSDAGLASGTTRLELVGASGDLDLVSAPGVAVFGVWGSGLGVGVLGVWESEPVWALAGKASIAAKAATLRKCPCLRIADRRI